MGRIGASLTGIERSLLNRLARANTSLTQSELRLASNQRINSARDNPSGLFALGKLQTELSAVQRASANVSAASAIVSGAQSALTQMASQLSTIRTHLLTDQSGTLTSDQRSSKQSAIDAAITQLRGLARTSVGGKRPLDGSADYVYSGINYSQVRQAQIYDLGGGSSATIAGNVSTAATQATLTFDNGATTLAGDGSITVAGPRGSVTVAGTTGQSLTSLHDSINQLSNLTGVTVAVQDGTSLVFTTVDYGSDISLQLTISSEAGTVSGTDSGSDAVATLNGAALVAHGNTFDLSEAGLTGQLEVAAGFTGTLSTITVSGEALSFSLDPTPGRRQVLAIAGLQPELLGGLSGNVALLASGGAAAGLSSNTSRALRIVDEAISQITRLQGRVDGFSNAVLSSSTSLYDAMETSLTEGINSLNEVDDDAEASNISLQQALAANAVAGLSILATQRADIVALIRKLGGLS